MRTFAFLLHPLAVEDVYRKFSWARYLPIRWVEKGLTFFPPFRLSEVKGLRSPFGSAGGYFISVMLTSRQMLELPTAFVLQRIIQAGRLAEKLGAGVVGLGAFTSVVGDAGITVARNLRIAVTTGNSLTAATAIAGTREAARLMGVELKKSLVAVVGATGSIGKAVCRILPAEVRHLLLVARDPIRLEKTAEEIRRLAGNEVSVDCTSDVKKAVQKADIILATSSSPDALIYPEDLKPGAIVCDIARPRDTSERVARERDDVLVFDGGLLEMPGDSTLEFNVGLPPRLVFACMAETMILAMEGRQENYSLGRELDPEKIAEIYSLALKHGFKLAELRYNEQVLDAAHCLAVRERAFLRRSSLQPA